MLRFLFILLLFIKPAFSYYNDWGLKGGVGLNYQSVNDDRNTASGLIGFSINSQVGYRWDVLEIDLASYVTFGKSDNIYFKIGDQIELTADGVVRNFNFIPLIKFHTNWNPLPRRSLYFSLGPSFSLRTFWPDNFVIINGEIKENYKITYNDYGAFGGIGIEQISTFKEENPNYLEIMLGYSKSRKITIVDASDNTKVKVVYTDDVGPYIRSFIFMLNLGITFF